MAPKKYKCNQCNKTHEKPIDEQCPSVLHNDTIESGSHDHQQQNDVSSHDSGVTSKIEWQNCHGGGESSN